MIDKWVLFQMPEEMSGKTFLDVGCWEGDNCVAALRRGARAAVGIDLCTSARLRRNVEEHGITFLQMDVLSEKFWELPDFDIVLCSGVLYHVENPLSLLFRLRKTTRELLFLETVVNKVDEDLPILLFHPGNDLAGNESNWWTPNTRCLFSMLETVGFAGTTPVYERDQDERFKRLCVRAKSSGAVDYRKILPRKEELMSLYGGDRSRVSDGDPRR